MNLWEDAEKLVKFSLDEVRAAYMLNRVISCSHKSFVWADSLNKYSTRFDPEITTALFNLVTTPKMKGRPAFPYPKKKKKKSPELMKKVCTTWGVNEYHAQQIIEILDTNEDKNAAALFGLKKGE